MQASKSSNVDVHVMKPFNQATKIDDKGTQNDTNLVQDLPDKQDKKVCGIESKLIAGKELF